MDKKTLRKEMLRKRNSLSSDFCIKASNAIFNSLKSSNYLNNKTNILVYSDFKNEVITDEIIDYLHSIGRAVYLPKCDTDKHIITAEKIPFAETGFIKNIYGIDELLHADEDTAEIPDCAIVPGIAFDLSGNRLGFGVGYYDRYFNKHNNILKIALAYDFQVMKEIPHEETDIRMDVIITEKGIIEM